MKKEDVLAKLKYFIDIENKGENEFLPIHLQLVDDSQMPQNDKQRCKDIIEKLTKDCAIHVSILKELEERVTGSKKNDF